MLQTPLPQVSDRIKKPLNSQNASIPNIIVIIVNNQGVCVP